MRETLTMLMPLGRMGRAGEVASAALFLASEESSLITSAERPVDGGMALGFRRLLGGDQRSSEAEERPMELRPVVDDCTVSITISRPAHRMTAET
ncbi:SDR family oxidoreductase [Brucella endophytica]|uniref:SDR family oxidoreductase n=1 Tax=Brucella endophytica TaxID=1963359 RepID=UPI001F383CC4|nr:SDR family oxidoreductase [Brucella endophytica]